MECSKESSPASHSDSSTGSSVAPSADRSRSMPTWIAIISLLLLIGFACGCGRTVLVSEASPIRIGPSAKIRVYTLVDGEWKLSPNAVTVSEGWYCVPPSFVEEPRK
jgi:hypothetical protein